MQDDRALTFRQIHGDKEALLSAVRDIERIAIVESDNTSPLRLRFLEPYPQGGSSYDYVLTPTRTFQLTDINDHEFLTVSYVWAHSQPIDGVQIPIYRIWDGAQLQSPPRTLRCPPIVFHRVVQYATVEGPARIWIDQECIDQEDPDDVERHLQDMHRIYRFSRLTVAVLSRVSPEWKGIQRHFDFLALHSSIIAVNIVRMMVQDPWSTRSWTFHEQQCAGNLIYLLPTPPLELTTLSQDTPVSASLWQLGEDVAVHQHSLRGYFNACEKMRGNRSALESYFLGHGQAHLVSANVPGAINTVQMKMEKRENRVFSDRIQIIANACRLSLKLKTTLLNTPKQSYSTCLLVLTMVNTWPDGMERARQYQAWGDSFMNGDIGIMLKRLEEVRPSNFQSTPYTWEMWIR